MTTSIFMGMMEPASVGDMVSPKKFNRASFVLGKPLGRGVYGQVYELFQRLPGGRCRRYCVKFNSHIEAMGVVVTSKGLERTPTPTPEQEHAADALRHLTLTECAVVEARSTYLRLRAFVYLMLSRCAAPAGVPRAARAASPP